MSPTEVDLRHLLLLAKSTLEETTHSVIIPMATEDSIQNNSSNLQNYKIKRLKEGHLGGGEGAN
jgi:hypothetical protein